MCRRVSCSSCGKPTWAGCGMHADQVLAGVPVNQRCTCREQASATPQGEASARPKWWPF